MHLLLTGLTADMDFTPPVPEQANIYIPAETKSFGESLWEIITNAFAQINPSLSETMGICICLVGIVLLLSVFRSLSSASGRTAVLVGAIAITVTLIQSSGVLIRLGIETVTQISDYGKLLLPVMTAALAAQGGATSSVALYTGTAIFNTVLSSLFSAVFIPLIYIYMAICVANCALTNDMLKNIRKFVKWILTWMLKIVLYIFTGYISITGVVSGTVDAAALKAAKIAISGTVPVVGSIMSDASEAVLVSAGVMKNSAGVFGLLVILALWIGPFLKILVQHALVRLTAAVCSIFGEKEITDLIDDFSGAMGFLLAAISVISLLFLISIVCFMRGMA